MYRVSMELTKHELKSVWENENRMGTRAVSECFHSFLEFSQTLTSVSITRSKQEEHVHRFLFLLGIATNKGETARLL